jgi:hypothetical protein
MCQGHRRDELLLVTSDEKAYKVFLELILCAWVEY